MSTTTTVKTSELSGVALDWAVAVCEGHQLVKPLLRPLCIVEAQYDPPETLWQPSCDWSQGGPIIEREKITLQFWHASKGDYWLALEHTHSVNDYPQPFQTGETPLIAAMRCYVARKLGETVEIPTELLK